MVFVLLAHSSLSHHTYTPDGDTFVGQVVAAGLPASLGPFQQPGSRTIIPSVGTVGLHYIACDKWPPSMFCCGSLAPLSRSLINSPSLNKQWVYLCCQRVFTQFNRSIGEIVSQAFKFELCWLIRESLYEKWQRFARTKQQVLIHYKKWKFKITCTHQYLRGKQFHYAGNLR